MSSFRRPSSRGVLRGLGAIAAFSFGAVAYAYLTLPDVRPLATANPTTTAWMDLRAREARAQGREVRPIQYWVPYTRISPHLKRAVIVAEDSLFFEHEGIDVEQIKESIQISIERGSPMRGASTLTQQLAKNLYLSPSRDPLRKLRELMITRRLEAELPKARIFEIYLNVIEWGDQVWGAEAAARTYFGVSASSLSREQAALLAGAIINPRVYSPAHPPRRLLGRQRIILARMGGVEPPPPIPTPAPRVDEASVSVVSSSPDVPEARSPDVPEGDEPAQPQPPATPTPETDSPR
ncbi:MAG TPA: monofunctional biosynthetic peptidoglycan transglycosylase [Vicinamibacterales bacterium]